VELHERGKKGKTSRGTARLLIWRNEKDLTDGVREQSMEIQKQEKAGLYRRGPSSERGGFNIWKPNQKSRKNPARGGIGKKSIPGERGLRSLFRKKKFLVLVGAKTGESFSQKGLGKLSRVRGRMEEEKSRDFVERLLGNFRAVDRMGEFSFRLK